MKYASSSIDCCVAEKNPFNNLFVDSSYIKTHYYLNALFGPSHYFT